MFTQQNRAEVPSQLVEDSAEVLCGEHLASDQEEDTDGCKPDDGKMMQTVMAIVNLVIRASNKG